MKNYFRENAIILSIPALYIILAGVIEGWLVKENQINTYWLISYFNYVFPFVILFFTILFFLSRVTTFVKGLKGAADVLKEFSSKYINLFSIGELIVVYIFVNAFLSTFSGMKSSIPLINPFSWDEPFTKLDQSLHMGNLPWELLQPILGYPAVTKFLDSLYVVWVLVMYTFVLWMAVSKRRSLRLQFFISFFITWIVLGNVLAIYFSSAGPCYYDNFVYGENPYNSLMSYLNGVSEQPNTRLYALRTQEFLLEAHSAGRVMPYGGGISAMPSLHIAIAALCTAIGWRVNRLAGMALTLYLFFLQVGSVHLGWHYAVDGYFSIIAAVLIWKMSGLVVRVYTKKAWLGDKGHSTLNSNMN